jgi:hypothetical protein
VGGVWKAARVRCQEGPIEEQGGLVDALCVHTGKHLPHPHYFVSGASMDVLGFQFSVGLVNGLFQYFVGLASIVSMEIFLGSSCSCRGV